MHRENRVRNAEASRERILDAALAEFSAYGIAGARVDRIAEAAGCNKNLIYIYFENKEKLFATVLQKNLSRVYEDLPFTPEDLPGFAVRAFDYAMAHPDLMRLIAWFGLEQKVDSPPERSANWDERVSALKKAQYAGKLGTAFPASFLLTSVMSLVTAYTAANPFGPSLNLDAAKRPAPLRKHIAEVVRIISSVKAVSGD
jgi:AcrR family transcriptional regulator